MSGRNKKMRAVAEAIDTLCTFALMDTMGTIRFLLEAFPGAHELVTEDTLRTLTEGLGYQFEVRESTPTQPTKENSGL